MSFRHQEGGEAEALSRYLDALLSGGAPSPPKGLEGEAEWMRRFAAVRDLPSMPEASRKEARARLERLLETFYRPLTFQVRLRRALQPILAFAAVGAAIVLSIHLGTADRRTGSIDSAYQPWAPAEMRSVSDASWIPVKPGVRIQAGTRIRTGTEQQVTVMVAPEVKVTIRDSTEVQFISLGVRAESALCLERGMISAWVAAGGKGLSVRTRIADVMTKDADFSMRLVPGERFSRGGESILNRWTAFLGPPTAWAEAADPPLILEVIVFRGSVTAAGSSGTTTVRAGEKEVRFDGALGEKTKRGGP